MRVLFEDGRLHPELEHRTGLLTPPQRALALTFGLPEMPATLAGHLGRQSVGKVLHEFDPFTDRW